MLQESQINQPYDNKPRYLQILLLALTISGFQAFSFFSSEYGENSSKLSIAYRFIFVIICLFVIKNHSLKKRQISHSSIIFVFIFWIIYLLRGIYDSTINPATIQTMIFLFWTYAFFLCFIPIISLITSLNITTLNYAKKAILLLTLFVNVMSLITNFMQVSENLHTRYNANEVLNTITYGQSGLVLIIISFSYFINSKINYKYIYLLFILIGIINIAIAASRGPAIQLLIVLIFFLFSNIKKIKIRKLIIPVVGIFAFIFYSQDFIKFSNVIDRISKTSFDEERTAIALDSWHRFLESPLLGSRAIGEWAHNIFLGSLEALGIVGGILIVIIYGYAIKQAFILVKIKSTEWIALLLVMYLVAALTSGGIWNAVALWPLIALASNLNYNRHLYTTQIQNI